MSNQNEKRKKCEKKSLFFTEKSGVELPFDQKLAGKKTGFNSYS